MPSAFPGMDPYLEDPAHWRDFHGRFVYTCRSLLLDRLTLPYDAAVVEQPEGRCIEVRHPPGFSVVTVVEVLTPISKTPEGALAHRGRRRTLKEHGVHHVVIDLLTRGQRPHVGEGLPASDYCAFVFRPGEYHVAAWPWSVRDRLPTLLIPLQDGTSDAVLDLAAAFDIAFDDGGYARRLRYRAIPPAVLSVDDLRWARYVARTGRPELMA